MRKKRTIFIELTSLLDVILIMIFVLLMQARTQTARAMDQAEAEQRSAQEISRQLEAAQSSIREQEQALQQMEQQLEKASEEADSLRRQLATREIVLENSLVLTISTGEQGAIYLEQMGQEAFIIPYDWADDTFAFNSLRSQLSGSLEKAEGRTVFVVFQYDRTRIYKTEYDMILRCMQEMKLAARQADIPLSMIEVDMPEP